ncbi:MAG: hypothetical protein ACI89L_000455 [Phycisphaerales bacterium]
MRPPLPNPGWSLAQTNMPTSQILLWVLVLIVLIVVGGLAVIAMRRSLLAKDPRLGHESGLMDQMRTMHARGELSDAEYDLIRKRLATKAAARLAEDPPPHPHDKPRDQPRHKPHDKPVHTPRGKPLTKEAQKWLDQVQGELDDQPPPYLEPRPRQNKPSPPESPGPSDSQPGHDEDGFPQPR